MQPAGGMDVAHRHGEDQPPGPRGQPARAIAPAVGGPSADGVVAVVDGLEQRLEVGRGPRLLGGRDQHQREPGPREADRQCGVEPPVVDRDDAGLYLAVARRREFDQRGDDRLGAIGRQVGKQDDADAGARQRIAPGVAGERVVVFLGHRVHGLRPTA